MSRPADDQRAPRDRGFTLVEVLVALGIVMVLVAAVLPLLVSGIRSNDIARAAAQSKGFAQAELERMRNLPFYIAPSAGDYRDVFDRYFRNVSTPAAAAQCGTTGNHPTPKTTWTGYVSASADRCSWEPSGAFYRYVRTESTNPELKGFVVVVDTRFLSDTTPPTVIAPYTGYNTQTVGKSYPPASQASVTVAVFQASKRLREPIVSSTQISRREIPAARMSSTLDVTAVDLGTANTDGLPVTLSAGLVKLAGELTYSSTANAVLASTTTGAATGEQAGGAGITAAAPPDVSDSQDDESAGQLNGAGCELACWGNTRRSAVALSAGNALPNAGSPTSPLQAILRDTVHNGLSLAAGAGAQYRPALALAPSKGLVTMHSGSDTNPGVSGGCASTSSGGSVRVASSGWLRTTAIDDAASPLLVESCGVARTAPVSVLPTTFAPDGVVRITLTDAKVRCAVSGAAHAATASVGYTAAVEVWGPSGYTTVATVTETTASDLLATVPLTTPVGGGHTLGDYISSWSAVSSSEVTKTAATGAATVNVPGIISLTTQPTREDASGASDPLSSVTVSVGVLSCSAADAR
ncbi:prepilin-type N-terminal cleavage/methylation domain-containing protein [Nocardioides sp. MAH-18]|uniref:Prepilin-type N-terminal cleavage/methylation domain-containing protein n=1 Tax=Nocardioides agri TaxID=2682843 RepID=A0A6L6XPU1_9ACTN|nr:type II secretion system protein [Nocardioides sp. CGMCC 1.13656]MBA2954490.1 type II secretion system protein [Nocardioides sp. CGMCC 1.13656]MVQ49351.1 prepilin-type N-terminal cleavage/methylation domain-containing protein [Nocardioides sp. MAH-18]